MARDLPFHRRMTSGSSRELARNLFEQARLLRCSAIVAEDYYHLGLDSPALPFDVKRSFLGSFEKWRFFDSMTPAVYDILARDKALFHQLAKVMEIRTPETLATTAPRSKPFFGERLDTIDAAEDFLHKLNCGDLFFKPVDGSLGEGAFALGEFDPERREWMLLPERKPVSINDVMLHLQIDGKLGRFLIQRRLKPHAVMADIVADVCPSIRLMTLSTGDDITILGAALRIGSGLTATDNIAGGGLAAPIRLEDGVIESVISLQDDTPIKVDRHPITGAALQLGSMPGWPEIKALALDSARKINFIRCIAWDIGVTDDGPVIIEINTRPRCISIQNGRSSGLLAGPLGRELAKKNGLLGCGLRI